jgi:hypothetical protein
MFRTLAVLVLAAALAPTAVFASGPPGKSIGGTKGYTGTKSSYNKGIGSNYNLKYGTKFDHGYYYQGRDHNHWSYRCWSPQYGCYCYWDPCCREYYYWCQPRSCFYPVSYCPCQTYSWPTTYVVESTPVVACNCAAPVGVAVPQGNPGGGFAAPQGGPGPQVLPPPMINAIPK